MKIIYSGGREELARAWLAQTEAGNLVEFVESVQPPLPREKKWVLIVSTLCGCPIQCRICDAGGSYRGKLSAAEINGQIDYLVRQRYPDGRVPAEKFKVQFARVGDPALNPAVIEVLKELPGRYDAPGLMPCISTVAPARCEQFFEDLREVKQRLYSGSFQMQFSLHSTDADKRNWLIRAKVWDFDQIAKYGKSFRQSGDRKIALNFALAEDIPLEASVLKEHFDPEIFLVKITPVNPTYTARANRLRSAIGTDDLTGEHPAIGKIRAAGFEVLVSIGDVGENRIGSNCGQYLSKHFAAQAKLQTAYPDQPES
jgi:23S rRNA (adenine2503-C2)-methyltransferase